jgi:hypothetical protein
MCREFRGGAFNLAPIICGQLERIGSDVFFQTMKLGDIGSLRMSERLGRKDEASRLVRYWQFVFVAGVAARGTFDPRTFSIEALTPR